MSTFAITWGTRHKTRIHRFSEVRSLRIIWAKMRRKCLSIIANDALYQLS